MVKVTFCSDIFALRDNPFLYSKYKCKPQENQTLLVLTAQSDISPTTKPEVPHPLLSDSKGEVSKATLFNASFAVPEPEVPKDSLLLSLRIVSVISEACSGVDPSVFDFFQVPQGQFPLEEKIV